MIDLSVIVPAYNEEANIGRSAAGVVEYLKAGARSWELLVVDDGSTDSTLALAERLAAAEPRVRVLSHTPNHGKGFAVREGMLAAEGAVRLFLDADYSTPIEEFEKLAPRFADGADIAIGSRRLPGKASTAASRHSPPTPPSGCSASSATTTGASTPRCWPSRPGWAAALTRWRSAGHTSRPPRRCTPSATPSRRSWHCSPFGEI